MRLLKSMINVVLLIVLFSNLFKINDHLVDYSKSSKTYNSIRAVVKENPSYETKLKEKNDDYMCWVKVANTNIDYPVMQSEDNSFYLDKDFFKEPLKPGSIFMDFRNEIPNDKHTVLYGHNMLNNTMFSDIEKFKQRDFFEEGNDVELYIGDSVYVYSVFSVYHETAPNINFSLQFNDENSYFEYVKSLQAKSMYKSSDTIKKDDKLLTLVTCSYERFNTRTVIHARLKEIKKLDIGQVVL